MDQEVIPGTYRHFKGNLYEVLGTAKHSETEETYVVYRTLYGNKSTWIRPLKMFGEQVSHEGVTQPRFKFIED